MGDQPYDLTTWSLPLQMGVAVDAEGAVRGAARESRNHPQAARACGRPEGAACW
ncbi:MAG: hypothetical protein R2748_19770 [Bryobacterales bacterium]